MVVTPLRARTQLEIRTHAVRLFAVKGYAATSLQDIADAVGCSKATVLYHYDGKSAVLRDVIAPVVAALDDLAAGAARLDDAAAQEHAIEGLVELAVEFRGLVTVLDEVLAALDGDPELRRLMTSGERLPRLLARADEPVELALAHFALNGLLAQCRAFDERSDPDLRSLLDTALRRLLQPGAHAPRTRTDGI